MRICLARNCNNSSRTTPDKKFFRLPTNRFQRKLWLEAVSCNVPLRIYNMYVCEDHFDLEKDGDHRYSRVNVLKKCQKCAIRQTFEHPANPKIEAEHQDITANTKNLNANAIPNERNVQETENLDDAFSFFVTSVIAHLTQMPVQHRLRVKNKIENIMKRGSILNL